MSSYLPASQATCHPCRRKARGRAADQRAPEPPPPFIPEWRTCPVCGQLFEATRGTQVYCRPACREIRWRSGTKAGKREQYGPAHKREKARLNPIVFEHGATCQAVVCLMATREIPPGTTPSEWHLGHTPDRTTWTGPEHPRCNTSEGATRGNQQRNQPRPPRRWLV